MSPACSDSDATQLSRRQVFGLVGGLGTAAALASCADSAPNRPGAAPSSSRATTSTAARTPTKVLPLPPEVRPTTAFDGIGGGTNVLVQEGIVRTDLRSSYGKLSGTAQGVPMGLRLGVQDLERNGAPAVGMAVYIWHPNRNGDYSLHAPVADQNYLRGVQVVDEDGTVKFTSIFPGTYAARWPHVHVEIFPSLAAATYGANALVNSQIAMPADLCEQIYTKDSRYAASLKEYRKTSLQKDYSFSDGWDAQLATGSGDPTSVVNVSITVGVAAAPRK